VSEKKNWITPAVTALDIQSTEWTKEVGDEKDGATWNYCKNDLYFS